MQHTYTLPGTLALLAALGTQTLLAQGDALTQAPTLQDPPVEELQRAVQPEAEAIEAAEAEQQEVATTQSLEVTGYADAYYAAFTGDYERGEDGFDYVEFETMSSRPNAFGLNSVGVATAYEADKIRANVELFWGEVQETAWAGQVFKNANVGYEVAEDFWIDAGYFSTYVGVESALPKDNMFSSVAVSTYQEPYYHAAVKASYVGVENLELELWLGNQFNGYNEVNKGKTLGAVARYTFAENYTLSYTGTYGKMLGFYNETPQAAVDFADSSSVDLPLGLYNNVNLVATPTDQLEILLNGSFATLTNSGENGDESITGVNGMVAARYFVSDLFAIAARGSFLAGDDVYGSANDFTLSFQLTPTENSYVRLAGRTIGVGDTDGVSFFTDNDGNATDRRFDLVLSAGVNLSKAFNF